MPSPMSGSTSAPPPAHRALRAVPAGLPLALLALLLALLAVASITLISYTRAYVGGESRYSTAQKSATLALLHYAQSRDAALLQRYRRHIAVPLGDREARVALQRQPPDIAAARAGFLQGANHPEDIDGLVRLFLWFRHVPFMARCIELWTEADAAIIELQAEADALEIAVQRGAGDAELTAIARRIATLDERLTPLQVRFSDTLGEGSRQTQLLLSAAVALLTLVLTALALTATRHAARKENQQAMALRESQAQRERALRGSSDGFWEWDLLRRTAYFSPRFEMLLGHAPGALSPLVSEVQELLHPDDREAARLCLRQHLQQGAPYDLELRMRHVDGSWRWLRSRALSDRGDDGRELRLSGSISDITERRQAQEALARREAMFSSLWQTTTDAVLIIDTAHCIRFANPAAHETFGHAHGTLVGQPLAVLQPERMQCPHHAGVSRYLRDGSRHLDWRRSEVMGLHADGREIPMEICFSELSLDGVHHFVGFLRDISHRKEAEHALTEANEGLERRVTERTQALTLANERLRELDRLKSEFLATMSHELRTPLNSILGFTDLMRLGMSGPVSAEQRLQLDLVHNSGRHLLALINDVLDLSRIESGRMEVMREAFDFTAVVAEVLAQLRPQAEAKGLQLHSRTPPALPLLGDRRKVYQVLLNLASNAVKFTDAGRVEVQADAHHGRLNVAVLDTGPGIAADQQALLFQAFRQLDGSPGRRHEGTGLGLHLSRKLLLLMHGEVGVDSQPGAGATFHFTLPLVLPAKEAENATAS
jgi:PAS domain S-box-containing protein